MIPKPLVAASLRPLLLSVLAHGESYGYAIIQRVKTLTHGDLAWTTSTLYPVLHSLEHDGLLVSQWRAGDEGPRRKYYRLTEAGEQALAREQQQWLAVHQALTTLWDGLAGPAASPGLTPG
ncbi:MAG: PadR family transcriptional regulator [Bacteroidota bacterium]